MKHTKRDPLWYKPAEKNARRKPRKDDALLEFYWRLYREDRNRFYREFL